MLSIAEMNCVPEGPRTERVEPVETSASAEVQDPLIAEPFVDDFERAELGDDYLALSDAWHIDKGRLCVAGAKNKGLWLKRRIPESARIEFDAIALSAEGDIKVELWGDGRSGASGTTYSDATGYIAIFGGWKNTKHVLARLDEHANDRLLVEVEPGSDDERARPVEVGQVYRFAVERRGRLRWSVGNLTYFDFQDDAPLAGPGHDHFGFNGWSAPVCFDNLRILAL
jgi:hypothetical protein